MVSAEALKRKTPHRFREWGVCTWSRCGVRQDDLLEQELVDGLEVPIDDQVFHDVAGYSQKRQLALQESHQSELVVVGACTSVGEEQVGAPLHAVSDARPKEVEAVQVDDDPWPFVVWPLLHLRQEQVVPPERVFRSCQGDGWCGHDLPSATPLFGAAVVDRALRCT